MTRKSISTTAVPGQDFATDVRYYLVQDPRQLPSRYLYDDLGSALFDAICHLPWYPITRAERRLLLRHGAQIFEHVHPSTLLELGCGNGDKLVTLLRTRAESTARVNVHLVDLSRAALVAAADKLARLRGVNVVTHRATYEAGLHHASPMFVRPGRAIVLFLGSNIGNFDPPASEALLRGIRSQLQPGDALLLGADLVKTASVMELAYDDPLGVTAAFNRNLLVRANRELGANFRIDQFAHRAAWNQSRSRMEMHLVARTDQTVEIPAARGDEAHAADSTPWTAPLRFTMRAGEWIWTESSYKYRVEDVRHLLGATGFRLAEQWIDQRDPFALTLADAV